MGLLNRWIESLDYEFQVLQSCTRHQSPHSTCSKCIESCSAGAISLKNGKPIISKEQCTECGDCIVTCPVQAVEGFFPKRTIIHNQFIVDNDRPPALRELLGYYKKGVTELVCEQGELNVDWQLKLAEANEMLEKLGEAPFSVRYNQVELQEETYTRRALFSIWKKEAQSTMKQMAPAKWRFNHEDLDIAQSFPNYQFAEIMINTSKCTLCKACQMLCPKKCLQITDTHFTISAQACSGCLLCQDICPEKAIIVKEQISLAKGIVHSLYENECKTCKKSFQTLSEHDEKCIICRKKEEFGVFL
ncbi:4Fe-4S binding protein [Bacillus sp. FJAT-29790]|uniref:4Fe-4S binding protein n=1 Tax=Bacillus sp. FJAT-29790 TaxID=1895002 RepID=UPI001C2253F5|nr:4Fe-4S binding protein [Bacillus sp. FJAT-29790]MBU8879636.1 4Fe-4S binding protein [Bacillus sp. FJAT-29790]